MPPTFITSPANTKNGIASRVKLSAPLMSDCATICGSNMSRYHISPRPHMSSEKAMGMPMMTEVSRIARKIATVI